MTPAEGADILSRAADLLLIDGWCQGQLHDEDGRHCMLGAIEAAWCEANGDDWRRYYLTGATKHLKALDADWVRHGIDMPPLKRVVGKAIGHGYVPEFNDKISTDEFQAADALKSAAKGLANGETPWEEWK